MRSLFLSLLAASLVVASAPAQSARHALDPLTWEEHWTVLEVLRDAGHLNDSTRFTTVSLQPPDKSVVWAGGLPAARHALAVVRQQARTFEAVVDLANRRLTSWTEHRGVQPTWLEEEYGLGGLVKEHPEWQAAMARRGYRDYVFVDCFSGPPGNFDLPEFRGRRVARVICFDAAGVRNHWGRFIEGLSVYLDANEKTVLKVVDQGVVPRLPRTADYRRDAVPFRESPPPLLVTQPLGAGFRMEGHQVTWQHWSFHVQVDQRVGLVLSTVRYRDGDRVRPILYQGHLSEIFVPYMDPSEPWYANNFLDAGEYTAGGIAKPLARGRDCPDHAAFLGNLVVGDNGRPRAREATACLFERVTGDMAWRHGDDAGIESRPSRDLVVRMAAVLGNYDYVVDWIFQQDGSIRVAVGATGIAEVKSVAATDVMAATGTNGNRDAARPDAYGRFVDRNIVAVNHDHYFNFRLDLDVDGMTNTFQRDRLVQKLLPADHPRRSLWVAEPEAARTERDAMLHIDMARPSYWRVLSAGTRNHVGYPTSYQLQPGMTGMTLLSEDDWPRRRAGFINHHLWVTPYHANERYAAGDYPTLSSAGQGLPAWTAQNRAIAGTDIVLWYTMGFHHMVRAEDWPVMPVVWHGFELRPFDFFDRNPALDLPEK